MRSITDLMSEPPASSQEACACRRSWTRASKSTQAALPAGIQTRVRKVLREIGVPVRVANNRSLARSASLADPGGELVDEVFGE